MKTLTLLIFVLSFSSFAQTITEVKKFIPNFTKVDKAGYVYRGKEPKARGAVESLALLGITEVVIFKNDLHGEVVSEQTEIKKYNMISHEIPFKWKDIDFKLACEQVIQALNIIDEVAKGKGKVFFHCTHGEDRTGLLAGVYRLISEGISTQDAFENEMCANGYSDGHPRKNWVVSKPIQKGLTPLFLTFADRVANGKMKLGKLTKASCKDFVLEPTALTCKKSKDFFKQQAVHFSK